MKVMCIANEWGDQEGCHIPGSTSNPEYGEICEVKGEEIEDNERFYQLMGYSHNYHESGFIPLSDIDERQLLEEREDQLVLVKR